MDVAASPENYADLLRQTGRGTEATTIEARTETIRAKHTELSRIRRTKASYQPPKLASSRIWQRLPSGSTKFATVPQS